MPYTLYKHFLMLNKSILYIPLENLNITCSTKMLRASKINTFRDKVLVDINHYHLQTNRHVFESFEGLQLVSVHSSASNRHCEKCA